MVYSLPSLTSVTWERCGELRTATHGNRADVATDLILTPADVEGCCGAGIEPPRVAEIVEIELRWFSQAVYCPRTGEKGVFPPADCIHVAQYVVVLWGTGM